MKLRQVAANVSATGRSQRGFPNVAFIHGRRLEMLLLILAIAFPVGAAARGSRGNHSGREIFYARGICGVTTFVGGRAQCPQSQLSTAKGAFEAASLQGCLRACETCNACAFVSFSRNLQECSWFAECDLHDVFLMNQSHAKQAVSFKTWDARLVPKHARRVPKRRASRDMIPDLAFLDEACGNSPRKTSIAACPAQIFDYANATRSYLREELAASRTLQGCETGFNCGHSSALFLEQDPRLHVVSFDMFKWEWSRPGSNAMGLQYGARSQQVSGNSLTTVPGHWLGRSAPPQCDLIHVDGGHTYVLALQDALHFIMHARCGALIVMDDVCDPAHCTTTDPWAIGPSQAWAELLRMGVVRETARKSACEGSLLPHGRHWVMGRVVCGIQAAAPTREPPPIRYTNGLLSTGLHAAFSDERSVETQGHTWAWPH
jgi:hypothetical protein